MKIFNSTRQTWVADKVDVADSSSARRKGLLDRTHLAAGEGLWIVPCESVHTFWMKFPIDLIYLDRNKKVRKLRSSVAAWRMSACWKAHSVLELDAGAILRCGVREGDSLELIEDR